MIYYGLILACAGSCAAWQQPTTFTLYPNEVACRTAAQGYPRDENDGYERRGVGVYNRSDYNFPINPRTITATCIEIRLTGEPGDKSR